MEMNVKDMIKVSVKSERPEGYKRPLYVADPSPGNRLYWKETYWGVYWILTNLFLRSTPHANSLRREINEERMG
jgi:hypothetical protein